MLGTVAFVDGVGQQVLLRGDLIITQVEIIQDRLRIDPEWTLEIEPTYVCSGLLTVHDIVFGKGLSRSTDEPSCSYAVDIRCWLADGRTLTILKFRYRVFRGHTNGGFTIIGMGVTNV